MTGRVLALDPGTRRVGVAVSDTARHMAFPRPALEAGPGLPARVRQLVDEEEISLVVVGLPKSLSGAEGAAARSARALAEQLSDLLEPPVLLHDERLTTVTASARLRDAGVAGRVSRDRVDGAAAVVLLESWMST